jgi:pyruvate carboxylase
MPWLMNKQIAGLPTNVGFLQELASHSAFERGLVDTHFIECYKDDLLSISTKSSVDHITSKESQRMLDLPFAFFLSTITLLI